MPVSQGRLKGPAGGASHLQSHRGRSGTTTAEVEQLLSARWQACNCQTTTKLPWQLGAVLEALPALLCSKAAQYL